MIRIRQIDLFACLTLLIGGSLSGCAASAIEDSDLENLGDEDPLANEGNAATADAGSGDKAPTNRKDASVKDDTSTPSPTKDASVSAPEKDAGAPQQGTGGSKDAGTAAPKDAGTAAPKDAGAAAPKDAGTAAPKDAGTTTPPPTNSNSCRKDADCKNSCVPLGILSCCTSANTCGCTWAPGAYCF